MPSFRSRRKSTASINPERWMSDLRSIADPNLPLSGLTLPGTHNSHALVGTTGHMPVASDAAECQSHDISGQLHMGVRVFDFRLGDNLTLRHGRVELPGHLPDVLNTIHAFLESHTRETVIVQVKWDKEDLYTGKRHPTPGDLPKQIADHFFSYATAYKEGSTRPTLGNSCGKMILWGYDQPQPADPYADSTGVAPTDVTDNREDKWNEVSRMLDWIRSAENAKDLYNGKRYGVNLAGFRLRDWMDVMEGRRLSPRQFAVPLNRQLLEYLRSNCTQNRAIRLGLVEVDFAEPGLISQMIWTNFP